MTSNELRIGNYVLNDFHGIGYVESISETDVIYSRNYNHLKYNEIKPVPLTEQWLLDLGFEDWGNGKLYSNEYETYKRYVMHNVLDGNSNLEVHYITSTYGGKEYKEFVLACDEDDRIKFGVEIEYVHQLQNMVSSLTEIELNI